MTPIEAYEAATAPLDEPPHGGDLFAAGLSLQQIIRFERAMKLAPDVPASDWWQMLSDIQAMNAAPAVARN